MRHLVVVVVLVQAAPALADRPVEATAGMDIRHYATKLPPDTAARVEGGGPLPASPDTSYAGDVRFVVHYPSHVYLGAEGEFGQLSAPDSNLWGAYGVGGVAGNLGDVVLGAELAVGVRTIRDSLASPDVTVGVIEPRVHADVWIAPQWTLGAMAGESLSAEPVRMLGFYVTVHSQPYDGQR